MQAALEMTLLILVLTNLALLGSSRLASCIQLIAVQGIAVSLLPFLWQAEGHGAWTVSGLTLRVLGLVGISFLLKGVLFPGLLFRTVRAAGVQHEVDPWIGYSASIVVGVIVLGLSVWMSSRFDLPPEQHIVETRVLPAALSSLMFGLLLIITRKTALMQVIGYLVLENGIFVFGIALALEEPFLIEMGILLGIFVAVFVMGIAIFHINREFDHIDVDQLSSLQD